MAFDAVIVGAGHNGLAAAILLARAGWKVLVLEAQPEPGGAVRTAGATLPGFRHDLYATALNAFAGSAFFQEFREPLKAHGLELVRCAQAFCSVFPDGDLLGVSTSLDETLADLGRLSAHDAAAWRALTERFQRTGPRLLGMLRQPMPSMHMFKAPLAALGLVAQSSGGFAKRHFEHPKTRALMAVWGMHLDYPPHVTGGALYPFLACMLSQANGLAFGRGGARSMIDAMAGLLREKGGELRCSSAASEIIVEQGSATGVVARGERIAARCAVIANLTPTVLYRLAGEHPSLAKARRYRYGPGTMMIHLALSGLPDWRNARAREFAYVHIAPSLEGLSKAYEQAMAGALPEEPMLVFAQPTVADPSRAPQGRHVASIQVRGVPPAMDKEAYAERILALVERYAPGLRRRILARHVISPAELERANPNLVGGDNIAGSHHLDQHFMFRPFLGWSRYRTPVRRLYLCGASTWPGAGTGAGSGWLLGSMLAGGRMAP